MASGSIPWSSPISQSEKYPGDGVKAYDFLADTRWWLLPQPKDNATSFWETSWETLKINELKAVIGDTSQLKPQDDHLPVSENVDKLFSDLDPRLTGINKNEPWWRTADINDLASLVSDKSVGCFDNFDSPQASINKSNQIFIPDKGLASLDQDSSFTESMPRFPTSVGTLASHLSCGLENPLSSTTPDDAENLQELSKAELLEALCHSQTRAREAEKAARQAYHEKEHMITHFLKQASHLFAYKQWLHILQLETTCLQLKNSKYEPQFPVPIKEAKRVRRKTKTGIPRYRKGMSFGSFLLGLTLVGAGLLLGWTLGWLFR